MFLNLYMQPRTAADSGGDSVVLQETESLAVSSISVISPEEMGAYCLMMLSRDKWTKEEKSHCFAKVKKPVNKRKYTCESCRKVFKSYQALGGHRASHKKRFSENAGGRNGNDENVGETNGNVVENKIHECPFCYRVFSSGQAMGGHKRTHLTFTCF